MEHERRVTNARIWNLLPIQVMLRSTLLKLLRLKHVTENFEHVDAALAEADENLKLAHNAQTKILVEEASGEKLDSIGFIFIHVSKINFMTTILL